MTVALSVVTGAVTPPLGCAKTPVECRADARIGPRRAASTSSLVFTSSPAALAAGRNSGETSAVSAAAFACRQVARFLPHDILVHLVLHIGQRRAGVKARCAGRCVEHQTACGSGAGPLTVSELAAEGLAR